jgi:hypothetical protein
MPLILAFVFLAAAFVFGQDPAKTGIAALSKELVENQSISDAETFAGYCAALGKFSGKDGNTFTFQPRIYDLDKLFLRKNIKLDTNYMRTFWERNLQVSIGITPNRGYILGNPTNCPLGFSYAILNNTEIPHEAFGSLMQPSQSYFLAQSYITAKISAMGNDTIKTMLRNIMNQRCYACLPKFLKDSVESKFGLSLEKMMERPHFLVDSLSKFLLRRPQLVANVKSIFGLGNRGEAGMDFKALYSTYLFTKRKPKIDPQVNVSASYCLRDDSTLAGINLNREFIDVSAGVNLIFFSRIELVPGASYRRILSNTYTDEYRTKYSPTGSVFIKIADKMVMGLNWSYNSKSKTSTANASLKTSLE